MEKEGKNIIMNKEYPRQVIHNAIGHHLLTDCQSVPEQQLALLS